LNVDVDALAAALAKAYGPDVTIENLRRDSGGASRLTCAFDARTGAGARHSLILRLATPGGAGIALTPEAALMRAAAAAGVPAPAVVAADGPDGPLGAEFVVMERVDGETIPRRVLRAPELTEVRPRLAGQCGEILAAIHRIPADAAPGLDASDPVDTWRGILDALGESHPALEYALRRLTRDRPRAGREVVVHGDFRNGNLIVGPDGVRAVLDWELAHLGDPLEDLGWLCVKAWRFGSPLPVGGFGTYDDLVAAYERAAGVAVDRTALRWWEMFGVFKWAVVCVLQAQRHLSGGERSVELAALGRRVAENEWDLLQLLP
jgi:aminoglycoside phosphotransferase (APT) family kinase protein